ncbi:MAG: T9SS type A sorting domain-containing protein [Bacteroidia bacterium]|nr:T9SS type A sorting domain-containing protein [Bacteroidia bacterium]
MKIYLFLLLTLTGSLLTAQTGVLDVTFGQNGYTRSTFTPSRDSYGRLITGTDGSLWVAGSTGFTYDYLLAKYTPAGRLDSTFSDNGWVAFDYNGNTDQGYALARQADGNILLCGGVVRADRDWGILRVDSTGTPDPTFGDNGWALFDWGGYDEAYDLLVQPDGYILVCGTGNFDFALARLKPNGTLDSTFATNGRLTLANGGAPRLALGSDGSIYCADAFGSASVQFGVLKVSSQGQVVTSFGTGGIYTANLTNFPVRPVILIDGAGKIVFGGTAGSSGGSGAGFVLARISATGSPDMTFDGDGKVSITAGNAREGNGLHLLPNGHLLVAGAAAPNGNADMALYCLRPDGSLDTGFGTGGYAHLNIGGLGEWAYSVASQPDGKLIIAGNHSDGLPYIALARFSGGALTSLSDETLMTGLRLYPNPTRTQVNIQLTLPAPATVTLRLTDLQGRLLRQLHSGPQPAGDQTFVMPLPADLPSGLYYVQVQAGTATRWERISVQ